MIEIIGKLLAAIAIAMIAYLEPVIKAWIQKKVEEIEDSKLKELVRTFVWSAEQQYEDIEKSGVQKKEYVVAELEKLGFELTEELNAMIEREVYELW